MKEKVTIEYVASYSDVTALVDSYTAALPITEIRVHPAPGPPGFYIEFHWREADGRNQSNILQRFIEMAEECADFNDNQHSEYELRLANWETFRDGIQLLSLLGITEKPSAGTMDKVLNRIDELRLLIEDRDHDLGLIDKKGGAND